MGPDEPPTPELADALNALGAGAPRLLGYADARTPASAPEGAIRFVDGLSTMLSAAWSHTSARSGPTSSSATTFWASSQGSLSSSSVQLLDARGFT